MADAVRASFYVSGELADEVRDIKKKDFYDKSYADLYRFLIEKGIESIKKGN